MSETREPYAAGPAADPPDPALTGVEHRAFGASGLELRAEQARGGLPRIVGYASVFDSPSFIGGLGGGFLETVRRGAFARTIKEHDIRALFNHDESLVLGRLQAGTLRLSEDRHGLRMEIDPPDTSWGRDVVEMVRRGDVSGASFGFLPVRQQWTERAEGQPAKRDLLEVRLLDVSPVTFPAYQDTEVSARAAAWAKRALAGGDLADPEWEAVRRLLERRAAGASHPASAPFRPIPPQTPAASASSSVRDPAALRAEVDALLAEVGGAPSGASGPHQPAS